MSPSRHQLRSPALPAETYVISAWPRWPNWRLRVVMLDTAKGNMERRTARAIQWAHEAALGLLGGLQGAPHSPVSGGGVCAV